MGASTRALLETLRAPLLPSPIADVLAGWSLARLGAPDASALDAALAAVAGSCLLAAGMAQNALADREDDAARKPSRPLPRGAIPVSSVRMAFVALTVLAVATGAVRPVLLPIVAAIIVLTAGYHYALKRARVTGCVALGALRALDMGLGAVAAVAASHAGGIAEVHRSVPPLAWLGCATYGLYIFGASLHASTDDEPATDRRPAWSRLGLLLCTLVLLVLTAAALLLDAGGRVLGVLAVATFLFALIRLSRAAARLPPPAITGAALSGLYLVQAGTCLAAGNGWGAALILALFALSRRLLTVFPPS